jgi:hypothetical protein
MDSLRQAGIPFMIGGGFALATFVGRWRDTKDIDLYIHPADRDAAVTAITQSGFDDYYSRRPYDRKWIYRSVRENVIADLIWAMANQRAQVDQLWFERAGSLTVRNQKLLVLPPEEFLWCKLYIMQRDHCDWTDVFNLIYAIGPQIDWGHVIDRLDDDLQLLRGLLMAYSWLCPKEVLRLPAALWKRLSLLPPRKQKCAPLHDRIRLLDSRQWFAATIPANAKLEV